MWQNMVKETKEMDYGLKEINETDYGSKTKYDHIVCILFPFC